jgi:hypothetical protein
MREAVKDSIDRFKWLRFNNGLDFPFAREFQGFLQVLAPANNRTAYRQALKGPIYGLIHFPKHTIRLSQVHHWKKICVTVISQMAYFIIFLFRL